MNFIRWFNEISLSDTPLVGGKNASLGEMVRELETKGILVPNGFAITTDAYRSFFKHNRLTEKIDRILCTLNARDLPALQKAGKSIRDLIMASELPSDLRSEIAQAYQALNGSDAVKVAVRSSATAEDLADASFAGQQESFLNITSEEKLFEACQACYASLFTDRAISYRSDRAYANKELALSIGVQKMVRSESACSGVMFTIDTESGFRDVLLINASYGLGENIVQGLVVPDEFYVFKPKLSTAKEPIIKKLLGSKESKLIYDVASQTTKNVEVPGPERDKFCISNEDILKLAKWGQIIEEHYSEKLGRDAPMDIEWAKDGETGEVFILQARPETVQSNKSGQTVEKYELLESGKVLVSGRRVGEKIGAGIVRIIKDTNELDLLKEGEILVTDQTDPDWEPAMKRAAAIVTNRGGRTCHAAIVARELGTPAIVGTSNATQILKTGISATVCCAEGEIGNVYEGKLRFKKTEQEFPKVEKTRTKVMLIVGNPDKALNRSFIPNDGVGLVRVEFIFSNKIKIHPMALINYPNLKDKEAVRRIDEITKGYNHKPSFLVDELAHGVATIAAAFYPNDVIVRFSDFKSNEYANLIGGSEFEPHEENPMLGFRGASRYYDRRYQPAFALECAAMKKVREDMGLTNVKLMIPFCRTTHEAKKVIEEIKSNGLTQGENDLEIYVMCEVPSNVILAEEFADIFDGFSIGSNDLTQLTLGVDRDSELVASIFDERNQAVKDMIRKVVKVAKAKGKKIGICGQGPSDYPELTEFLVSLGIDSIALNPDVAVKTKVIIKKAEDKG